MFKRSVWQLGSQHDGLIDWCSITTNRHHSEQSSKNVWINYNRNCLKKKINKKKTDQPGIPTNYTNNSVKNTQEIFLDLILWIMFLLIVWNLIKTDTYQCVWAEFKQFRKKKTEYISKFIYRTYQIFQRIRWPSDETHQA